MDSKTKIGIIGAGVEGVSLALYFNKKGFRSVTLLDANQEKEFESPLPKEIKKILGKSYLKKLTDFDMVFRSPGVPFLTKEIQEAIKKGVRISSLTKYFFENCPCRIIGVTGTKGKGTAASLIAKILEEEGCKVFLGGNIGKSPIEFLDRLIATDIVVLELSSFQLQDMDKSPHVAVLLAVTSDHLDHHKDREEYIKAKQNLVRFQRPQDFAIYNEDDKISRELVSASKGQKFGFSIEKTLKMGGFLNQDKFLFRKEKDYMEMCKASDTNLIGRHNLTNIAAAITAAGVMAIPPKNIKRAIQNFKSLPHRLQFIQEINGVKFYDDSASTNPDTAIAALRAINTPAIFLLGGSDKGADYTELGDEIVKRYNVRAVIVMGQTGPKIEAAIDKANEKEIERIADLLAKKRTVRHREIPLELVRADSFPEACMAAKLMAHEGDSVVLSPASASFDMFANYRERGELWQAFVRRQDGEAGL